MLSVSGTAPLAEIASGWPGARLPQTRHSDRLPRSTAGRAKRVSPTPPLVLVLWTVKRNRWRSIGPGPGAGLHRSRIDLGLPRGRASNQAQAEKSLLCWLVPYQTTFLEFPTVKVAEPMD